MQSRAYRADRRTRALLPRVATRFPSHSQRRALYTYNEGPYTSSQETTTRFLPLYTVHGTVLYALVISFAKVFRNHVITFARCLPLSLRFRCYLKPAAAAGIARAPAYDFKTHATGSSARRKQHEAPMHLTFPWQRRASQDTGEAIPPRRSLSPVRFAFARPPKTRSPSPQRRSPTKEPVQMAPSESAEFAAAAGSASSVDERTLRTLLMRQPAAQELGLTDDALMDSFVRSCAVSSKPSPDSPSSVVSPGPRARYTCAQYLRVVADLSQYGHDVRLGTLLVGNGRSVLQSNAGGLVDNHGLFRQEMRQSLCHAVHIEFATGQVGQNKRMHIRFHLRRT